ncbi:MAG: hypothetical protein ACK5LV_07935 [Lachnospirales bacterium]
MIVHNKDVYNIPIAATRWGKEGSFETYFAMLWLGTTVYPEYYKDVNLKDEALSFYNDIIGIEIDDQTYELILAGEGIRKSSDKK